MSGKAADLYFMRPMNEDDIPVLARWFEHLNDLALFDRRLPLPLNEQGVQVAWRDSLAEKEPRLSYWFALDDQAGDVVGVAGLQEINYAHGDGVLAIYMIEPQRLKGIGLRAGAMLLDLAFSNLRLGRVTSFFRDDNEGSRRLTSSMGFRQEGLLRESWFAGGRHIDVVVIGILEREWKERRKELSEQLGHDTIVILGRTERGTQTWPSVPAETLNSKARS